MILFLYFFQLLNDENPHIDISESKSFVLSKIDKNFTPKSKIWSIVAKAQKQSLYALIEKKYSNIEVYVLLKKNVELLEKVGE